ncbi:MAG: YceI family protein [Flavobacteriales bacterium]
MKTLFLSIAVTVMSFLAHAQIYELKDSETKFFSSTVVEDIEAITKSAQGLIDFKSGEYYIEIPVATFDFEKDLMEEHFNENYLETEDYPKASFSGFSKTKLDTTKVNTYIFSGNLTIHGKTMKRDIKVTIKPNADGTFGIESTFEVKLKDHKIKIPKIVFANIAETIEVSIQGKLEIEKPE